MVRHDNRRHKILSLSDPEDVITPLFTELSREFLKTFTCMSYYSINTFHTLFLTFVLLLHTFLELLSAELSFDLLTHREQSRCKRFPKVFPQTRNKNNAEYSFLFAGNVLYRSGNDLYGFGKHFLEHFKGIGALY